MLTAPTMENLQALKLDAMAVAWTAQQQQADLTALAFDERFGLLVDAEWLARENKRLAAPSRRPSSGSGQACIEDIDYPAAPRARQGGRPPARHLPLGRRAPQRDSRHRRDRHREDVRRRARWPSRRAARATAPIYRRASRLFDELALARADGSYIRLLGSSPASTSS